MPPKKDQTPVEDVGAAKFGRVRNNLRMGIVGLPNVGKSSLFNILTKQSIAAVRVDTPTARSRAMGFRDD